MSTTVALEQQAGAGAAGDAVTAADPPAAAAGSSSGAAAAAADEAADTMRVLCLHGYRQSGQAFRQKTGAFRKLVKSLPSGRSVQFDFVDAPHPVEAAADEDGNNSGFCLSVKNSEPAQRAWWFSRFPGVFNAAEASDWEYGLAESIDVVVRELRKRRYDGLLGFSQGAALAFIVLRYLESGAEAHQPMHKPLFGLLVAPFRSPCTAHEAYYAERIDTPCLVVSGETDQVIPRPMTEALLPLFARLSFLGHSAGHIVPAKAEFKAKYLEFLRMFDVGS